MSDGAISGSAQPMTRLRETVESARRESDPAVDSVNLVTIGEDGHPCSRILTLRTIDDDSITVTAHRRSPKVRHLESNGRYEAHFYWPRLLAQARLRGTHRLEDPPSLAEGWAFRAYGGQIADLYQSECRAQSSVIESRELLLEEVAALRARFPESGPIEKPEDIVNVVLQVQFVELWIGDRVDRVHDRRQYHLEGDTWREQVLVP